MFSGRPRLTPRTEFAPGHAVKTFIQTKEPELKGAFDEWLARVVCYAFSVSPQAFVSQVNRATGETQKEMAEEGGLRPILNWVKRLIDRVLVEDFGERGVELVCGQDSALDPTAQAQTLVPYVGVGIFKRNEARARLCLAPVGSAAANALAAPAEADAGRALAPAQAIARERVRTRSLLGVLWPLEHYPSMLIQWGFNKVLGTPISGGGCSSRSRATG